VQKARLALEDRDPTVRILSPADGEILPDGPWTLRLQAGDWPLVDGGPLGLGPHLVVQLDGEPPRPTVDTEVVMPPLTPGSHRLTVYAAKPWGEAHKSPLALRQIRIHRLAPNPATLPAPGTPQLIPVSPSGQAGSPPLLLDWLLIDTPLQGLRSDSAGWRLRLTVNGESVLVDQQTPLWLQGWKPGANALLLELLDGRGEPLNPPFNSLLREVNVPAAGAGGLSRAPDAPLTDLELAVLLGEQPVSALAPPPPPPPPSPPLASPTPDTPAATEPAAAPEEPPTPDGPALVDRPAAPVEDVPSPAEASPPADDRSASEPATEGQPPAAEPSAASTTAPPLALSPPLIASPPSIAPSSSGPESGLGSPTEGSAPAVPPAPALPESPAVAPGGDTSPEPATALLPVDAAPPPPATVAPPASAPLDGPPAGTTPAPAGPVASIRAAREEVNTDGTLRRSARPSSLQWLRERLGR
jgi:hypothetical protein